MLKLHMKYAYRNLLTSTILVFLVSGFANAADEAAPNENKVEEKKVVDVRGDGGVQAVQEAQASPTGDHYKPGAKADALIRGWLKEGGYKEGWDKTKNRYIAIGKGEFNSEDPSIDPGKFCLNREIAAQRALLDARSQIVEFANSKMDIAMQAETPGTDLNAQFGEKMEAAQKRLAAQQKAVAKLLEDMDKKEAEALQGATTRDRIDALMDAAIKKLDATYSKAGIEEEKRTKFQKAKDRYQEASSEMVKIQEEIKKQAGSVTRSFSNRVTKLAKMPLFGSTCIFQTESWDSNSEQYSVVVALVWSVGLEKATRAIIQGIDVVIDKPAKKGQTLEQWLEGQDLGAMVGPRTYMDETGSRHFLGIAARPVVNQASRMEKNRDSARLLADQMAVLSLRADVEVAKQAEQLAKTVTTADGKEEEQAMESLQKTVSQKLVGQNINGLGRVHEVEVKHALTGATMLVTVSGIDPDAVKAARNIEEINYAAAIAANKENSRLQGRKDQLEASKEASKNDNASYNKGRQDASAALDKQEADRAAQAKAKQAASAQAEKDKSKAKQSDSLKTLDGATGAKPKKTDDDF